MRDGWFYAWPSRRFGESCRLDITSFNYRCITAYTDFLDRLEPLFLFLCCCNEMKRSNGTDRMPHVVVGSRKYWAFRHGHHSVQRNPTNLLSDEFTAPDFLRFVDGDTAVPDFMFWRASLSVHCCMVFVVSCMVLCDWHSRRP